MSCQVHISIYKFTSGFSGGSEPSERSPTLLFAAPQPLGRSNGLLGMPRGHCAARKTLFELASVPPMRSKRPFELTSVPPLRSKRLFEPAVRDHYSKGVVGYTVPCASLLCSPGSVHGYARVRTSIYIRYMCLRILGRMREGGAGGVEPD